MNRHRPSPRLAAMLAASLAAALLAAGCGSKSSNSDVANPPTTTESKATTQPAEKKSSAAAQKLEVSSPASGDLKFEPNSLTAKAGEVTITYKNPSPVPHNLAILGSDGKPLGTEMKIFTSGQGETTATVAAGTYKFICEVPGHAQAGMVGELKVS